MQVLWTIDTAFITWYVDRGAVVEIFRKEVGIKCGTHENNLQVWSLHNQVFEHQQKEVTEKHRNRPEEHECTLSALYCI